MIQNFETNETNTSNSINASGTSITSNKQQLMPAAKQLLIKHVLNSEIVQEPDKPSFARTVFGNAFRVNVIGIVVFKDESTIVLDDGTGTITVRFLPKQQLLKASTGDCVQVIGRVRKSFEGNYLSGEFLARISKSWLGHRKQSLLEKESLLSKELSKHVEKHEQQTSERETKQERVEHTVKHELKISTENIEPVKDQNTQDQSIQTRQGLEFKILDVLSRLDTGPGVSVQELKNVLKQSINIEDNVFESVLNNMILKGLVFEVRPGFLKTL